VFEGAVAAAGVEGTTVGMVMTMMPGFDTISRASGSDVFRTHQVNPHCEWRCENRWQRQVVFCSHVGCSWNEVNKERDEGSEMKKSGLTRCLMIICLKSGKYIRKHPNYVKCSENKTFYKWNRCVKGDNPTLLCRIVRFRWAESSEQEWTCLNYEMGRACFCESSMPKKNHRSKSGTAFFRTEHYNCLDSSNYEPSPQMDGNSLFLLKKFLNSLFPSRICIPTAFSWS
jgi:hypothetical protein